MENINPEYIYYPLLFIVMGFRHGMDADHIAAISDLIGLETERKRQIAQGLLYAVGHSFIVLCIGLTAALLGLTLSKNISAFMELVVGITLLLLGSLMLFSVYKEKHEYTYRSRIGIVLDLLKKKFGSEKEARIHSFESMGAFVIGIIHGVGAETPTQLTLFASSVGLKDIYLILFQVFIFILGLFSATLLTIYSISWAFTKASKKKKIYIGLGLMSGLYSVILGLILIWEGIHYHSGAA